MSTIYSTPHGEMKCFETYLVFTLTSDTLNRQSANEIMHYAHQHFGEKKYVFIANREFASKVDPKAYKAINTSQMVGLAIVSENEDVKQEAIAEQDFFDGSFGFFKTLTEAIDWSMSVVKQG